MIKYTLTCDQDHSFESWFRDSAGYDELAGLGQLSCPICGSTNVRKAMMAPSVVRARKSSTPELPLAPVAESATPPQPVALLDQKQLELRNMMRELHRKITETADNVGREFSAEARRMHEGETPARSIYGEATGEEVRSLLEDGIPLLPMPVLPDDQH
jgi:hypothetical protein